MLVTSPRGNRSGLVEKYGVFWQRTEHPISIEINMLRAGGRWKNHLGKFVGLGLEYHFIALVKLLWPRVVWHKWLETIVTEYVRHRTLVIVGPASSGKTFGAALCVLTDYYCFPYETTVIICSTTRERLEDRIWGEIKSLHKEARQNYRFLPGNMIEGRQRLVSDHKSEAVDGRDFRNGVVGVPCKRGTDYVGLGDFIGIKNKRVRLLGDELHLLPRVFVDAISNLDKNPDFKCVGLGNPKETTDALGVLAEPSAALGGWEGGIDQSEKSKTWDTRRPDGICVQLVGTESPNLDGKLGIPLITQAAIDRDIAFYGKDSLQFTMMNLGMMPRGQGSRRVITRQMCAKFGATEMPVWRDTNRTKIGALDAAYRGVGGDRCVFCHLEFGTEGASNPTELGTQIVQAVINQSTASPKGKTLIALIEMMIVPIKVRDTVGKRIDEVEDQIVEFCKAQCTSRGIPPENFFYDSGMRTSLVTSFTRLWSVLTNPIDCGGQPSERKVSEGIDVLCKDYYSKRITEFWFSVRLCIEAEQMRGLNDEVIGEGCAREWKMVGNNKIEVETKEEMKLKTGRSPDLFDCLAVAVEGARQRGFQIGALSRRAPRKKGEIDWRDQLRQKMADLNKSKQLNYAA